MGRTERSRSPIRQALAFKDFRNLALANAISETGDWLYNVALLVYVFEVTGSAGWVALASFFRLLPSMLVTPFAGVLADRYERRAVMMASAGLGAVTMALLSVVAATTESAPAAVALAFICNAALTPYRPAVAAITPSVLPERNLAAGNTLLATISYAAIALGPALGAVLLVVGSPSSAFAFNAVSFLLSVAVLTRVRARSREEHAERPRIFAQFREGMQATFSNADARVLTFLLAAASFLYGQEIVAFVVYSDERLGLGPDGVTYMTAAIGVGGLLGAAFTSRVGNTARPGRFLWISAFLSGGSLIALALVTVPWLAYGIITVDGAGALLGDVVLITLLQRTVSQRVLGRVFGAVDSLGIAGILLGTLVAPVTIELFGIQATLVIAGAMLPLLTLLAVGSIRRLDQRSAQRKAELDGLVDLLSRSQLMQGAPRQALELVAAKLESLAVGAGTDVVVQGDAAENLYVIRTGSADVLRTEAGVPTKLATLGADDFFGEIGVIEGTTRNATVTATTDTELLKIDGDDFKAALELSTAMAGRLSSTVAGRLSASEMSEERTGGAAA